MNRWELYLQQTHAMGVITLAFFIALFGLFALWYLLQVSQLPVIQRKRPCLLLAFWTYMVAMYLTFVTWLFYFMPT